MLSANGHRSTRCHWRKLPCSERFSPGGDQGIDESDIEMLLDKALGSLSSLKRGSLTQKEQQSVLEVPSGFWTGELDDSNDLDWVPGSHDEL